MFLQQMRLYEKHTYEDLSIYKNLYHLSEYDFVEPQLTTKPGRRIEMIFEDKNSKDFVSIHHVGNNVVEYFVKKGHVYICNSIYFDGEDIPRGIKEFIPTK